MSRLLIIDYDLFRLLLFLFDSAIEPIWNFCMVCFCICYFSFDTFICVMTAAYQEGAKAS